MRFFYLLFTLSLFSCGISKPTNYSFEVSKNSLHPQFLVYHLSEEYSELHFKVSTDELLYSRKNVSEPFSSKLSLKYIIYKKNQKEIIDSGSHLILDYYSENKRTCLDTSFKIQFPINQLGNLDIEIVDLNRSKNFYGTLPINKSKLSNRQFFLLKDANNEVVYNNYFSNDQSIFIESNFNKRNLYATNNNISFPLSPPPFSKSHQPIYPKKTSFSFLLPIENQKFFFRFPEEGFVFFQLDTLSDEGFTLFNFHSNYPELKDPKLLIPPLRYLSTKQEYNQLISNSNPKLAVDKYWLGKAASKERARSLIRTYYSRVELANKLFTCHLEGWKTDRGLISIIFGPPTYISNNRNSEVWSYGDDNNINSLKFIFDKKTNPFSSNDFVLKRNYSYKNPWYRAVESWRNGKVYMIQ